jgi:hypothetical protein
MTHGPEGLGYVEAELTMRRTEDGGRQHPIRTGYRPNWWLPGEAGHVWAGGTVELLFRDELLPGETGTIRIYPFVPEAWHAVKIGSPLEMCEGPVLIGKGTVARVVPAAVPMGAD